MNKKNTFAIIIMIVLGLLILTPILSKAQVERIKIINVVRNPNGYLEIQARFKARIPTNISTQADFELNASTLYKIDSIEVIDGKYYSVVVTTFSMPLYRTVSNVTTPNLSTPADMRNRLKAELDKLENALNALIPLPFGSMKKQTFVDSTWITN